MLAAPSDRLLRGIALAAAAFGLLTIWAGGNTLFGSAAARQSAGAYVPFVLWFNFLAGFAYVAAAAGLWQRRRWAVALGMAIPVTTLVVFAAFGVHVLRGGAFGSRTVAAMTLRSVVWLAIAWVAARRLRRA
jgi:hypothetical protein